MKMKNSNSIAERIEKYGLKSFNDLETLELLLNINYQNKDFTQESKDLLDYCGGFSEVIDHAINQPQDLPGIEGLDLFGLKLPYLITDRYLRNKIQDKPILSSSGDVYNYLKHSMGGLMVEQFRVLYLNGRNQFIRDETVSNGTLTNAAVYPREIVKSALKYNAAALILAHNHPSGNPIPSRDDKNITNRISDASKLFDITVHDHIIVAGSQYVSLADKGLLN
jgi:DNA repair protein RadC